jgi:hypothetical protein
MSFYSTFVPPILCTDLFLLHTAALSNLRRSHILCPYQHQSVHPPDARDQPYLPWPPRATMPHQFPIPKPQSQIQNPPSQIGILFRRKKHTQNNIELRQNLAFPKHDGSRAPKMPHHRPIYGMRDRIPPLFRAHFSTARTPRSSLSRIIPIPGTISRPTQRNGRPGGVPYPISNAVVKLTHLRYNALPVQRTGTDHR